MTGELKRIGFVKTYAATATNMAGSAYATAKTFVPKQLAGTVESTEALVVSKATPIASWAIGKGEAVLGMVDAQVRLVVDRGGVRRPPLRRPGAKRSLLALFRETERGERESSLWGSFARDWGHGQRTCPRNANTIARTRAPGRAAGAVGARRSAPGASGRAPQTLNQRVGNNHLRRRRLPNQAVARPSSFFLRT
jgi:hypothetical protein